MPHTKSAEKRLRQNEKRRRRNRAWVKQIKGVNKEAAVALKGSDKAAVTAAVSAVAKKLDKAAAKGVIHKNKAARLKSRLAKKANAVAAKA